MTIRLQIFLVISILLIIFFVFKLIRQETLQLKYSLLWIFIAIILVLLTIFPTTLDMVSFLLGIDMPTNTLFLLGMLFELMILFSLTVALSKSSERIKNLSQEIALLRKEMEDKLTGFQ